MMKWLTRKLHKASSLSSRWLWFVVLYFISLLIIAGFSMLLHFIVTISSTFH